MTLTLDDIARLESDPRWDGHGYPRARAAALASTDPNSDGYDPEAPTASAVVRTVDDRVIAIANSRGWTYDRLFEWANSRHGRHFADAAFDGGLEQAVNVWRLI